MIVLAHSGPLPTPDTWRQAWNLDPVVLLNLGLLAVLYARGVDRLRGFATRGNGVSPGQVAAFGVALAAVAIALLSPLDALSDALAWMHMVQHMLLMMVAAPLLILANVGLVVFAGLPADIRPTFARWRRRMNASPVCTALVRHPLWLWALFAATLWIWHIPGLYQMALLNPFVHDLQHLSFFVTSFLFWRVVLDPMARRRMNPGAGVLYLFAASLQASALGIYLSLAPEPWYRDYEASSPLWGLSPLEDQQLAGLIMWMPGCVVYAITAAFLMGAWLNALPEGER